MHGLSQVFGRALKDTAIDMVLASKGDESARKNAALHLGQVAQLAERVLPGMGWWPEWVSGFTFGLVHGIRDGVEFDEDTVNDLVLAAHTLPTHDGGTRLLPELGLNTIWDSLVARAEKKLKPWELTPEQVQVLKEKTERTLQKSELSRWCSTIKLWRVESGVWELNDNKPLM